MSTQNCVPDVPDVQSSANKAIATAKGKVADLDFRPVDFGLDINRFFTFDVFGRILGKPGGQGYDMCAICDSGDIDAAIAGSPFPNGAQDYVDGINSSVSGINSSLGSLQDQIDNLDSA